MKRDFIVICVFMAIIGAAFAYVFINAAFGYVPSKYYINGNVGGQTINATITPEPDSIYNYVPKDLGDMILAQEAKPKNWTKIHEFEAAEAKAAELKRIQNGWSPEVEKANEQTAIDKDNCDKNPMLLKDTPTCKWIWKFFK